MYLSAIEILNFGIFKGKHQIRFKDKDIIGVLAEYEDDPERSNRGGKSLALESILYNLTGYTRTKSALKLIHHGETMMQVIGIYKDDDGKSYKIKRGCTASNERSLSVDWIEKTREAQKAINDLFGIDSSEDILLTNFFQQSEIHGFMGMSPTEKTQFLMKWMRNDHWKVKEGLAKEDRDSLKSLINENDITVKALNNSLVPEDNFVNELNILKKGLSSLTASKETIEEELSLLNKKITIQEKDIKDYDKKLKDDTQKVNGLRTTFNRIKELRSDYKTTKLAMDEITELAACFDETKKNENQKNLGAKLNAKTTLENQLRKLKSGKGMCPILESSCDLITVSTSTIKDTEVKSEILDKDISKLEQLANESNKAATAKIQFDRFQQRLQMLKKEADSLNFKSEDLDNAEHALQKTKETKEVSSNALHEIASSTQFNLDEVNNKIARAQRDIGAIVEKKTQAKKTLEKITSLNIINEKQRAALADLNYICLMFGKNGIPADEIENEFQAVEDNINFVLTNLDTDFSVSFSPDKEIAKMEPICHCGFVYPKGFRGSECTECNEPRMKQRKDELSLKIMEGATEADFDSDSGGGKVLISYAVRLALSLLKRNQGKAKLDMIFLDEVDSAFDKFFRRSIVASVIQLLTKKLGFKQVFLISHDVEIKNSIPNILKITRHQDKTSSIELT